MGFHQLAVNSFEDVSKDCLFLTYFIKLFIGPVVGISVCHVNIHVYEECSDLGIREITPVNMFYNLYIFFFNQLINQSAKNQSINQSIKQSVSQSVSQ